MKTNVYARFIGLFLAISVASASASDQVSVKASRDLQVAIVDSGTKESRAVVHPALASSFSAGMTHEFKAPVQVKLKVADASRAAKDLRDGNYDAVVVIGNSVPSQLLKEGFTVLKATDARSGSLNRTFYLLARSGDSSMNQVIGVAFDHAMKSANFQQALTGKSNASSNLAATTP